MLVFFFFNYHIKCNFTFSSQEVKVGDFIPVWIILIFVALVIDPLSNGS